MQLHAMTSSLSFLIHSKCLFLCWKLSEDSCAESHFFPSSHSLTTTWSESFNWTLCVDSYKFQHVCLRELTFLLPKCSLLNSMRYLKVFFSHSLFRYIYIQWGYTEKDEREYEMRWRNNSKQASTRRILSEDERWF